MINVMFSIMLALITYSLIVIASLKGKIYELEKRIRVINDTLDQVTMKVDIPEHPINAKLRKLLKEGKEITAVKEARLALGLSLIEGKKYIDKLKNELK